MPIKRLKRGTEILIASGLVIFTGTLTALATDRLPLERLAFGFDWHIFWQMLQGGGLTYTGADAYNPPWTFLWLWPLGQLSFHSSWGLLTLITLLVLILSVPRTAHQHVDLVGLGWLLGSYLTLRQMADGNLAALMIGGCLLLQWSYQRQSAWAFAAGVLLVTAKMQESVLVLFVLAIGVVRLWPPPRWLAALLLILAIVVPSLWLWGEAWLGNLLRLPVSHVSRAGGGVTLRAITELIPNSIWLRLALGGGILALTLYLALADVALFDSNKVAFLLTASLLLSPYAGELSLASVLALGVIPLRQRHLGLGTGLAALSALPLLYVAWVPLTTLPGYYWALWLVGCWSAFGWQLARQIKPLTLTSK